MTGRPRGALRVDDQVGPEIGDAFGAQLRDAWRLGRPMPAYVERSDGMIAPSGSAQWLDGEQDWPAALRGLLGLARGRVLDVGAGGGRHAEYLLRRSFPVTALDNSPLALEVCGERGVRDRVLGDIEQAADLLGGEPPYGTVLLLGNNVGLLGSRARGTRILRRLSAVTTDDAVILAEGRRPVAANDENRAYVERNRALGRLPGELLMRVRYGTLATPWFPYLFCDPAELAEIAEPAGWRVAETEDFRVPGAPADAPPLSYTAVLRKA